MKKCVPKKYIYYILKRERHVIFPIHIFFFEHKMYELFFAIIFRIIGGRL